MSKSAPTIKPISWLSLIPQLLILGLLIVVFTFLFPNWGLFFAGVLFVSYSLASRFILAKEHRKGILLIHTGKYQEAIEYFQNSFKFFEHYSWLDKYRAIILMSSSKISYREMALVNIGYYYSQMGDGKEAMRVYQSCLDVFPESSIATASLNMLNAGKNA